MSGILFCRRERIRSPSPHSIKSSQLKNKITDTSLFAELVKDRQKREMELKKLENMLEKKSDNKCETETTEKPPDEVDNKAKTELNDTNPPPPLPVCIDEIPIPSDNKLAETTPVRLDEIDLPNNEASTTNLPEKKADSSSLTSSPAPPPPPLPNAVPNSAPPDVTPPPLPNKVETKVPNVNAAYKKSVVNTELNKVTNKPKSITKLPMPPGINQTDLEVIESPPSRSPSPPPPPPKPKTPPRKSIMNLPMPPGGFYF